MILVGFRGPMQIIELGNQNEVNEFFVISRQILVSNSIDRGELIYDRLYKRYVKFSQLNETADLMSYLDYELRKLSLNYKKYFDAFSLIVDEVNYLKKNDELYGRVQVCITNAPYYLEDKLKSNEFYDSLSDNSPPHWMRKIE